MNLSKNIQIITYKVQLISKRSKLIKLSKDLKESSDHSKMEGVSKTFSMTSKIKKT